MPVNDITATRGYQLPHTTNNLDHDVARLRASFSAIDADVAGLLTSVAGKAAAGHAHVISDVSGLQSALDAKLNASSPMALDALSDVDTAGAVSNMFLRYVNGVWIPVAFDASMVAAGTLNLARMPAHGHSIAEVTALQAALDGKQAAGAYAAASHSHAIGDVTNLQTSLDGKANTSGANYFSGVQTYAGRPDQWEAAIALQPSTHATSERAGIVLDAWYVGQDFAGNGTKDFFIYTGQNGGRVVRIDAWGTLISDTYAINGLPNCSFGKNIGSGHPGIAWDANDYIQYDRGNNVMYFGIGGVTRTYMSGSDIYINDPFVPGWFRYHTSGYHSVYRNTSVATEGIVDYSSNWGATGRNVYRVQSNGTVLNYTNSYGSLSDRSLKENIADATPKLSDVMNIRVRNFNMKGDTDKQIGVVAQEIEQVFPRLVETDENGIKSVKYSVLVPILVKALQELKTEFDAYRAARP
jgi:hypothetical protein